MKKVKELRQETNEMSNELIKFLLDQRCKYCIWKRQSCFGQNKVNCVRKWLK